MSNVTEMHAIWVPWDLGIAKVHRGSLSLDDTQIACISITLLILAPTHPYAVVGLSHKPKIYIRVV